MQNALSQLAAKEIIRKLELQPHPEGGYYRETFRDDEVVSGRSVGTAIYYLLPKGQVSHWHRVDATEIWHYYAGAALELGVCEPGKNAFTRILGTGFEDGQFPQHVIPKGWWQRARSLGEWTLVGCTVSPGFVFSGFEIAKAGWEPGASE